MKKLKVAIVFTVLVAICSTNIGFTADESYRTEIEKTLQLTNADKMIESMLAQLNEMLKAQFTKLGGSNEQRPILDKYNKKMFSLVNKEMSWGKLQNDYIDIYARVFTEEEISAINNFYSSSAGKKMVEKMPIIMQEITVILLKKRKTLFPKIQQITKEMTQEITNSK